MPVRISGVFRRGPPPGAHYSPERVFRFKKKKKNCYTYYLQEPGRGGRVSECKKKILTMFNVRRKTTVGIGRDTKESTYR